MNQKLARKDYEIKTLKQVCFIQNQSFISSSILLGITRRIRYSNRTDPSSESPSISIQSKYSIRFFQSKICASFFSGCKKWYKRINNSQFVISFSLFFFDVRAFCRSNKQTKKTIHINTHLRRRKRFVPIAVDH